MLTALFILTVGIKYLIAAACFLPFTAFPYVVFRRSNRLDWLLEAVEENQSFLLTVGILIVISVGLCWTFIWHVLIAAPLLIEYGCAGDFVASVYQSVRDSGSSIKSCGSLALPQISVGATLFGFVGFFAAFSLLGRMRKRQELELHQPGKQEI